jgi:hypothetical protein
MTRSSSPVLAGTFAVALLLVFGGCEVAPTGPAQELQAQQSRTSLLNPDPRPFHATTVGQLVSQALAPEGRCPADLPLLFTYHGAGQATHLGAITVDGGECVFADPADPSTLRTGAGEWTITAANGDKLMIAYAATTITLTPDSPWVLWSTPIQLTDGTGRFAHAQLVGVVWHGGANMVTGESWSAMDGAIIY